eukprot:COSAG05_NODE_17046_length_333_cov_0.658120_1_plen_40_part_10
MYEYSYRFMFYPNICASPMSSNWSHALPASQIYRLQVPWQ